MEKDIQNQFNIVRKNLDLASNLNIVAMIILYLALTSISLIIKSDIEDLHNQQQQIIEMLSEQKQIQEIYEQDN